MGGFAWDSKEYDPTGLGLNQEPFNPRAAEIEAAVRAHSDLHNRTVNARALGKALLDAWRAFLDQRTEGLDRSRAFRREMRLRNMAERGDPILVE